MVLSMNYLAGYFLKAAESFYVKLKPYYLKRKNKTKKGAKSTFNKMGKKNERLKRTFQFQVELLHSSFLVTREGQTLTQR